MQTTEKPLWRNEFWKAFLLRDLHSFTMWFPVARSFHQRLQLERAMLIGMLRQHARCGAATDASQFAGIGIAQEPKHIVSGTWQQDLFAGDKKRVQACPIIGDDGRAACRCLKK